MPVVFGPKMMFALRLIVSGRRRCCFQGEYVTLVGKLTSEREISRKSIDKKQDDRLCLQNEHRGTNSIRTIHSSLVRVATLRTLPSSIFIFIVCVTINTAYNIVYVKILTVRQYYIVRYPTAFVTILPSLQRSYKTI